MSQASREGYYRDLKRRSIQFSMPSGAALHHHTPFWGHFLLFLCPCHSAHTLLGDARSDPFPLPLDILGPLPSPKVLLRPASSVDHLHPPTL